jgi:hypothetical protein
MASGRLLPGEFLIWKDKYHLMFDVDSGKLSILNYDQKTMNGLVKGLEQYGAEVISNKEEVISLLKTDYASFDDARKRGIEDQGLLTYLENEKTAIKLLSEAAFRPLESRMISESKRPLTPDFKKNKVEELIIKNDEKLLSFGLGWKLHRKDGISIIIRCDDKLKPDKKNIGKMVLQGNQFMVVIEKSVTIHLLQLFFNGSIKNAVDTADLCSQILKERDKAELSFDLDDRDNRAMKTYCQCLELIRTLLSKEITIEYIRSLWEHNVFFISIGSIVRDKELTFIRLMESLLGRQNVSSKVRNIVFEKYQRKTARILSKEVQEEYNPP